MNSDAATIQALRTDLALQIARHLERAGLSQVAMAARLAIPQPTLSKIANGRVGELSLELLLRIAVRAGLQVVLQTGTDPLEAGAYVTGDRVRGRTHPSRLGDGARNAAAASVPHLSPEQRLEAQLQHSSLLTGLQRAAREPRPRPRPRLQASPSARAR